MSKQILTCVKLFKCFPIVQKDSNKISQEEISKINKQTIQRGFIFSEDIFKNYNYSELNLLIKQIESVLWLSGSKLNSTFHKSWDKVKNAKIEQLVLEQMIHYLTTYGFKSLGIYNDSSVYFPKEYLNIPNISIEEINLILINGSLITEIKEKIFDILVSGIALSEDTKNDLLYLLVDFGFSETDLSIIKNKEIKMRLFDILGKVPADPVEFLRFLIYQATGTTLIIKSAALINQIKTSENRKEIKNSFKIYSKMYGLKKLSEIFLRFKPIFLAFKKSNPEDLRSIINILRRKSVLNHKPMRPDYLNNVTNYIKNDMLDLKILKNELESVNVFRKIRLAYALKFRLSDPQPTSILYKIRNGKSYATNDVSFTDPNKYKIAYDIVLNSIVENLSPEFKNKLIYIPSEIEYALPVSEKQFVGNFPFGTCVSVDKGIVIGIHWFNNTDKSNVDLDLSFINHNGTKFGWDGLYRSSVDILFSGDITSAPKPNGATEAFHIINNSEQYYFITVNLYYSESNDEIPFDIIVAKDYSTEMKKKHNYMIDPNKVIAIDKTKISNINRQKIIGAIMATGNQIKFYYFDSSISNLRTMSASNITNISRQFLFDYYYGAPTINEILEKAGSVISTKKDEWEISLAPEVLEKTTFINLFSK